MSDLRSAIEAATSEVEKTEPISAPIEPAAPVEAAAPVAAEPTPADSPAPSDGASPVTPDASAKAASDDKPKSITEVAGSKAGEPSDTSAKPETDKSGPDARVDRAPASWKGDAKKIWGEIPLQVRQEVTRRERQITQAMQEVAQERKTIEAVHQTVAPHMDRIQTMYKGDVTAAIGNLMRVEQILTSAPPIEKAQFLAKVIKQFGIDINALDEALSGSMTPQAKQQDDLASLIDQKLAPVMTLLEHQRAAERQAAQQVEQQAEMTIAEMSENPDFPYFDDVRYDMADLIELEARRGNSLSLEDAYNKAVRMNDSVFQASSARTNTQAVTNAALAAHQAAQRAKGAAVSVSGAPSSAGPSMGNSADLRGTIASAFEGVGNRV